MMVKPGLLAKRLGIDTHHEHIVFLHRDSSVYISEGFAALTRIEVHHKRFKIHATVNVVCSDIVGVNEVGLSECSWKALNLNGSGEVFLKHIPPVESYRFVRRKMKGKPLSQQEYLAIIEDVVDLKLSSTHLTAFITASSCFPMNDSEVLSLTRAMIDTGEVIKWPYPIVADKHCIGGLPGNRTTPIVVAIAVAAGLIIPKTSSRAITSPAGTADTLEAVTKVDLSVKDIKRVVKAEGGCFVWGGALNLSPADDVLIQIERALDIDSEGQMIASILSKKLAAGSTHVLIDIPVGKGLKVQTRDEANHLKHRFEKIGRELGLVLKVVLSDGSQPIGRGIGPGLEARDILDVLSLKPGAPKDLRQKSVQMAGELIELCDPSRSGRDVAQEILESGKAFETFKRICEAQGGYREPEIGSFTRSIHAQASGKIETMNNFFIGRIAKLAGAPINKGAGVVLHHRIGDLVNVGDPILTVYSHTQGELEYALDYAHSLDEFCLIV